MRKFVAIFCVLLICLSLTVFAEEYSNDANVDYGYDESYDETPKQEDITSSKSDNVKEGYDEDYDETINQDVTSSKYDDREQSYNKAFDERITNSEEPPVTAPNGIKVFYNGKQLTFDVEPMLINNRTMVPMRVIFEALGAKVSWDDSTQTAFGETKNTTVKITIGKDYILKNDNIVVLDSPAVVISGRTLVPVRAIAESLDCKVEWYDKTQVVEILK